MPIEPALSGTFRMQDTLYMYLEASIFTYIFMSIGLAIFTLYVPSV